MSMRENIKKFGPIIIISIGVIFFIIGLLQIKNFMCASIWVIFSSVFILSGFYLKDEKSFCLHSYSKFIIGIAAVMTIAKAPDLLSKVVEIQKGIKALEVLSHLYGLDKLVIYAA